LGLDGEKVFSPGEVSTSHKKDRPSRIKLRNPLAGKQSLNAAFWVMKKLTHHADILAHHKRPRAFPTGQTVRSDLSERLAASAVGPLH
jgi:hypothetical protein